MPSGCGISGHHKGIMAKKSTRTSEQAGSVASSHVRPATCSASPVAIQALKPTFQWQTVCARAGAAPVLLEIRNEDRSRSGGWLQTTPTRRKCFVHVESCSHIQLGGCRWADQLQQCGGEARGDWPEPARNNQGHAGAPLPHAGLPSSVLVPFDLRLFLPNTSPGAFVSMRLLAAGSGHAGRIGGILAAAPFCQACWFPLF